MVVVAIAAEIINAAMIWGNLFAFIQPFKPSAPRQVAAILSVGATLTSLLGGAVVEGQNLTLGGVTFGRATLQPGWKWSTCVKPIVNTESCQAPHLQYHVSGRLRVRMDDGSEDEFGPGEASLGFVNRARLTINEAFRF